jgi:propionate catabolism operon transcriptional regulator
VIWTVSVSRLSDLFRDITLEYDDLPPSSRSIWLRRSGAAHPRTHGDGTLRRRDCGGSNAAYLKGVCPFPW